MTLNELIAWAYQNNVDIDSTLIVESQWSDADDIKVETGELFETKLNGKHEYHTDEEIFWRSVQNGYRTDPDSFRYVKIIKISSVE